MEYKRAATITLAWIVLFCISSGYCDDDICHHPNKDTPPGTSCDETKFEYETFKNIIRDYAERLQPLCDKIFSYQELSPDEVAWGTDMAIEYYTFLADAGIYYGEVARDVAANVGSFGILANVHLKRVALKELRDKQPLYIINSIPDKVRVLLVCNDAQWRLRCRFVPYDVITHYHFDVLRRLGLSILAWGGASLEFFAGSGSWVGLGCYDPTRPFNKWNLVKAYLCNRAIQYGDTRIEARQVINSIGWTVLGKPIPAGKVSAHYVIDAVIRAFRRHVPRLPKPRFYVLLNDTSHDSEEYVAVEC